MRGPLFGQYGQYLLTNGQRPAQDICRWVTLRRIRGLTSIQNGSNIEAPGVTDYRGPSISSPCLTLFSRCYPPANARWFILSLFRLDLLLETVEAFKFGEIVMNGKGCLVPKATLSMNTKALSTKSLSMLTKFSKAMGLIQSW